MPEETPAASLPTPEKPKTPRPSASAQFSAAVLYLVEMILPVVLACAGVYFLFAFFNLWQNERTFMLILFGVAVVAISLFFAVILDSLTVPAHKRQRKQGVSIGSGPRARLLRLMLGGLLLPLALMTAANLVALPGQPGTAMEAVIRVSKQPVKLAPPDEVGALALSTKDPATKVLSIQVLRGFRSPEGMTQLLKLASDDPTALADPAVSAELSKAIAAYGSAARESLFGLFKSIDPAKAGGTTGSTSKADVDAYERYFAAAFDGLKSEISTNPADAAVREAQLAQLQAAQAQLKSALAGMKALPAGGDPRLSFVLRTFLAMDLKQDKDVLAFARATAADERYAAAVRGDALLLVGQLGGKDDLTTLYGYLKSPDVLVQARALQAIAAIQDRLNGTPASQ